MLSRMLKNLAGRLIRAEGSPRRVALAFSVGVFIGCSPLLGLHTVIGLGVGFLFGLNRAAILLGLFVNNPWTLVPIYASATYLGGLLVGFPSAWSLPDLGWNRIWHSEFWLALYRHWEILTPMFVGSVLISLACALISYPLALAAIKRARMRRCAA